MQRSRYALAAALALALVPALGTASQRDVDKVMGSITAHAGEQYGDLTTVNGSIRVEKGAVARDATTVNGSIHIEEGGKVAALLLLNFYAIGAAALAIFAVLKIAFGGVPA